MISILYFFLLLAPIISVFVLTQFSVDIGELVFFWDINFWAKFFIMFAIFIAYYFFIRVITNYLNGGIRRGIFFPVSFGALWIVGIAIVVLCLTGVVYADFINTWTFVFLGYLFVITNFGLIVGLLRTKYDGAYYCDYCGTFGCNIAIPEQMYHEGKVQEKDVKDLHSYQKKTGTTERTEVTWEEEYGRVVPNSMKTETTYEDHYTTEYYTTNRHVKTHFMETTGTLVCKKCGKRRKYYDYRRV